MRAKRQSRRKKSASKKSRKRKGGAKRRATKRKVSHAITVQRKKIKIFGGSIRKTVDKGSKFRINFTIDTGNHHEDLDIFSNIVYDIDEKPIKEIKIIYKISKGTLIVEILLLTLFTLSMGVLGNQISRIINRIRDKKEIENLRISVESKLILARDRLEREKIFVYILSEPDRIRDYHVWSVTQANGINLNILVYDNGEIELLR